LAAVLAGAVPLPLTAGQSLWTPGGNEPTLVLSLGDGVIKKTLDLPSGTTTLTLTLRPFLSPESTLRLTWKSDGRVWMTQVKKMPGAETSTRVVLPPGRLVVLEIATLGGVPEASITLRRS